MKNRSMKRTAAVMTAALVMGGVFVAAPTADAAAVVYTCTGASGDIAATQTAWGTTSYISSANLLGTLAGSIPNFPARPTLSITINPTTPAAAASGSSFGTQFDFTAELPASLVTAARDTFGLNQLEVKNATFGVNVANGSPSTISGGFASKIVPLTNAPVSVQHSISGVVSSNAAPGTFVQYTPGNASISIVLNKYVDLIFTNLRTITLNCTPAQTFLGATTIVGGATTTTTTPATTTTTTTTAPATTTTTAPATTTTVPATTTTTTPATTTTTTAPATTTTTTTTAPATTTTTAPATTTTTTTAPATTTTTTTAPATTTTTAPQAASDTAKVKVSGAFSYNNQAAVTSGGFKVTTDGMGIASINGSATIPGAAGGNARVAVTANRFLFWTFGTVTVSDPGAGIGTLDAPLIFAPSPSGSKSAARVSASWFKFEGGIKSYTIDVTVGDN